MIDGIVLYENAFCDFASAELVYQYGYTGKTIDISYNMYGIYINQSFCGELKIDHYSCNQENVSIEYNTYGILCENHTGSVVVSRARMVNNGWAIHTFGKMELYVINGAFNRKGLVNDGGSVDVYAVSWYGNSSDIVEHGIYNNYGGILNLYGGLIMYAENGIFNNGLLNIYNANITLCTNYDIYNNALNNECNGMNVKNNDVISSTIYLAQDDNYIDVGEFSPTFNSISVSKIFNNRKILKSSSEKVANQLKSQINVINKENYKYCKKNENGLYYVVLNNQNNVAVVSYDDSISPIVSAKYWYSEIPNGFNGEGAEFSNGQTFEMYGYYKIVVINDIGLQKEVEFALNVDSI